MEWQFHLLAEACGDENSRRESERFIGRPIPPVGPRVSAFAHIAVLEGHGLFGGAYPEALQGSTCVDDRFAREVFRERCALSRVAQLRSDHRCEKALDDVLADRAVLTKQQVRVFELLFLMKPLLLLQ